MYRTENREFGSGGRRFPSSDEHTGPCLYDCRCSLEGEDESLGISAASQYSPHIWSNVSSLHKLVPIAIIEADFFCPKLGDVNSGLGCWDLDQTTTPPAAAAANVIADCSSGEDAGPNHVTKSLSHSVVVVLLKPGLEKYRQTLAE